MAEDLKTKGTEIEPENETFLTKFYIKLPDSSTGISRYIRDFFTCLEFLTRIRITKRNAWFDDEFSRSVAFFTVIGCILGTLMATVNYGLVLLNTPIFLKAVLLLIAELLFVGGLMYDGFMDTADGVFSGRTRERVLEIMQDSHVGANSVIAIIILLLLKVALYSEISIGMLGNVLLGMFVFTRMMMAIDIILFPLAKEKGLGAMFKANTKPWYLIFNVALGLGILGYLGINFILVGLVASVFSFGLAFYLKHCLGGLTGDTYGALTECGNIFFLLSAYYILG